MNIKNLPKNVCRWTLLHLTLLVCAAVPLSASQTVTWDGGTGANTLWSNNVNWAGDVLPADGDIVVFPASPTLPGAYTCTYDIAGGISLAQIDIVTPAIGSTWTINASGSPLPIVPLAINVSGPTVANINAPLGVVDATTCQVSVTSATLNLNGVISGVATGTGTGGNIIYTGPDIKNIAGTLSNTYTGTTTVQQGTLNLQKTGTAKAIAGPLKVNAVTAVVNVKSAAGAADEIADNVQVTVASGGVLDLSAALGTDNSTDTETIGGLSGVGSVVLGSRNLGFFGTSVNPTTFDGVISGTGAVRKSGTNTQRFSGANSYTGTTTLSSAAVTVVGLQPSSNAVLNDGTLKLAAGGSVGNITTTTATNNTALVIGNEPSATNVASSKSIDLSGNGANTSRFDVFAGSGTTGSLLTVTGTVTLGNVPLMVSTAAFTPTAAWTIIDNDSNDAVVGTFLGHAEGSTVTSSTSSATFSITYHGGDGNDVVLTPLTAPADTTPPTASAEASGSLTSSSASVSWTTSEPSDSQVEYGTSTLYGNTTAATGVMVSSHTVSVTGLTPGTLYHYRVVSTDAAGNTGTGADQTFTTTGGSGGSATAGTATAGTTGVVASSSGGSSCGLGGGGLALLLTLGLFAARRRS